MILQAMLEVPSVVERDELERTLDDFNISLIPVEPVVMPVMDDRKQVIYQIEGTSTALDVLCKHYVDKPDYHVWTDSKIDYFSNLQS